MTKYGWVVLDPKGRITDAVDMRRREAQKQAFELYRSKHYWDGLSCWGWKDLYRRGYRCVVARIEVC